MLIPDSNGKNSSAHVLKNEKKRKRMRPASCSNRPKSAEGDKKTKREQAAIDAIHYLEEVKERERRRNMMRAGQKEKREEPRSPKMKEKECVSEYVSSRWVQPNTYERQGIMSIAAILN